jgi:flagellar biosynthesis/type III secretory pathway chaperone
MNTHWELIVTSLREELAEYGGLLRLFEIQQRALFDRDPDAVLLHMAAIEAHTRTLSDFRQRREQLVAAFAVEQGRAETSTLRSLLPLFVAEARPLLEALIDEINRLLHRVRRTSRHNHTLLARAVAVHQETLQVMRPHAFTKTYSPAGRVSVAAAELSGPLRATG